MRYMEWLLRRLRESGFPPELAYHAYHALDSHILGYTMWDYESDAPAMWPDKQQYPSAKRVHEVLERNPEGAAPRGNARPPEQPPRQCLPHLRRIVVHRLEIDARHSGEAARVAGGVIQADLP